MKKNRVYVIEETEKKDLYLNSIIEFLLGIIAYALILLIANNIFKGFYVENFMWAMLATLIISLLNLVIKPALILFTLPLTISTLGIFYPIVNVIILKITALLLGSHFNVNGLLIPFIIAIFISLLRLIFDKFLVKPIMRGIKL